MHQETCPMCQGMANLFCDKPKYAFYECKVCKGIFQPASNYITAEQEKAHYEKHNNDVNNFGYQQFVSPIVNAVLANFNTEHCGLDFGSGTGPVIYKMLQDKNFNIKKYDLYFDNDLTLLNKKYNYVACCEVMEHFKLPLKEFTLLKSLLLPNGKLYCKTNVYTFQKPFVDWYYKNDPTHIFIYQPQTLHWLKDKLGFKNLTILENLIVFEN